MSCRLHPPALCHRSPRCGHRMSLLINSQTLLIFLTLSWLMHSLGIDFPSHCELPMDAFASPTRVFITLTIRKARLQNSSRPASNFQTRLAKVCPSPHFRPTQPAEHWAVLASQACPCGYRRVACPNLDSRRNLSTGVPDLSASLPNAAQKVTPCLAFAVGTKRNPLQLIPRRFHLYDALFVVHRIRLLQLIDTSQCT